MPYLILYLRLFFPLALPPSLSLPLSPFISFFILTHSISLPSIPLAPSIFFSFSLPHTLYPLSLLPSLLPSPDLFLSLSISLFLSPTLLSL